MNRTKLKVMMIGLMLTWLSFTSIARADGSRSYISPSGSDNRPCSRTQPCRSFDGALAKTDDGGEILVLETGVYDPTTISKSITLSAVPGADVTIKANAGSGVTISAPTSGTVTLRDLRLIGPGNNVPGSHGVFVDQGQNCCVAVFVENALITNFDTGVHMDAISGRLSLSDSVVRNNNTGLYARIGGTYAQGAAISRSRFERNMVGIYTDGANAIDVSDSVVIANGTGFLASGGKIHITHCFATKNGTGIKSEGFGIIRIGNSTVTGNDHGITAGNSVQSMGNNMVIGNDIDVAGSINVSLFSPR